METRAQQVVYRSLLMPAGHHLGRASPPTMKLFQLCKLKAFHPRSLRVRCQTHALHTSQCQLQPAIERVQVQSRPHVASVYCRERRKNRQFERAS